MLFHEWNFNIVQHVPTYLYGVKHAIAQLFNPNPNSIGSPHYIHACIAMSYPARKAI